MSKKIISHLKQHSRFLHYYFLIITIVPILVFSLYSLLPPKVNAFANSQQQLDQAIVLDIWGFLDRNSLTVKTNPPTPVKIVWQNNLIPLKNTVKIIPTDLFIPNSAYSLDIKVNNRLGFLSQKMLTFTTNPLPKLTKSSLDSKATELTPKSEISFTFSNLPQSGEIIFSSYPKFEFHQENSGNRLIIQPNKLSQNQTYSVIAYLRSGERFFGPILEKRFTTISPLETIATTPNFGETTVLKQTTINSSFSKDVNRNLFADLLKTTPTVEYIFNWKDNRNVELIPTQPLKSNTKYILTITHSLQAIDKSELQNDLNLEFTTAGAVSVTKFHPSGGYPYINTPVEVTFNQPVDQVSAQEKFSISPNIPGTFSWSGNTLIFKPKSLEVSREYRLNIAPGVKSIGGEDSVEAFTNSFTTTSEVTKTIGYSVRGRPIIATYFGIGPKKILLVGSMHGSEANTGSMLGSWISFLRNNQSQIPSDRTFVIVPYSNPDGKAVNNRFNANGVDLNRNWATPDWQSLTFWQNRSYQNGGGNSPFSEPETRALRDLVLAEKPSLTITYHANANLVLGDGISQNFGDWYSKLTGYTRGDSANEEDSSMSALGYTVTGSFEDWSSRLGHVTLLVEFISATANEYQRNFPALKGLLTYLL